MQENFETMVAELEQVEAQICTIQDNVKILRLQINEGLDEAMKGLEELKAKLPKEQSAALFEQCTQNENCDDENCDKHNVANPAVLTHYRYR